jgi:hypothetical protein
VKLALNIFAIRLVLEAARGAIMWVLTEVLFGIGRANGKSRQTTP